VAQTNVSVTSGGVRLTCRACAATFRPSGIPKSRLTFWRSRALHIAARLQTLQQHTNRRSRRCRPICIATTHMRIAATSVAAEMSSAMGSTSAAQSTRAGTHCSAEVPADSAAANPQCQACGKTKQPYRGIEPPHNSSESELWWGSSRRKEEGRHETQHRGVMTQQMGGSPRNPLRPILVPGTSGRYAVMMTFRPGLCRLHPGAVSNPSYSAGAQVA
jgi:hypothetical protein